MATGKSVVCTEGQRGIWSWRMAQVLRFLASVFVRMLYRVRIVDVGNVPADGPAVLVFNRVSRLDCLLIASAAPRPVVFVDRGVGEAGAARRVEVSEALRRGDLVCIFPEKTMTPDGYLGSFDRERLDLRGFDIPVVPGHIDGMWGTVFSVRPERWFRRMVRIGRREVTVRFGSPVASDIAPYHLRARVQELEVQSLSESSMVQRGLAERFIHTARRCRFHRALGDTTGREVTFGTALTGSLLLAEILRSRAHSRMVGVMLPATVAGVLTNVALTLLGRVPVNLNFTASREALETAIRECDLKTIITSRKFLLKLNRDDLPEGMLLLEDLVAEATPMAKLRAAVRGLFVPTRVLCANERRDSLATVIYSSGATGEPKGIVLSHKNVLADIESMHRAARLDMDDTLCAALPFFHSFGYTTTLWMPLVVGFAASYHANPLDGEAIARVVRESRATVLLATPTFLRAYLRKASREDFVSLRLVVVGAEKMRSGLARQFEERFGIKPYEGYGATELSPVTSLNVPDSLVDGIPAVGNRLGTIGRTLPGITAKVVDPETGKDLEPGESGMLLVKGGNVMMGYLGRPRETGEAVRDGWYVTGDIVTMDEDGFITVTDRLSRFSKLAGEMVPHGAVEEVLLRALGTDEKVLVVTAVPDEARGERLIVLYTPEAGDVDRLRRIVADSDLPNLWKPSPSSFCPVETIPILGTGKTDLMELRRLAREAAATTKRKRTTLGLRPRRGGMAVSSES